MVLYWFFAVLWGTRSAALSVVAEIRERTWDGQKLSAIGPGRDDVGQAAGRDQRQLVRRPAVLVVYSCAPVWQGHGRLVRRWSMAPSLSTLGLFAQTVALLSSLVLIRRNTGNWRMDTFLCQLAGIGAAFAYYSLWSSAAAFEESGQQVLNWWGRDFNLTTFHLVSLLVFLGWALVGCWRAMRAELRFANGPWVWLAYLAFLAFYNAGFESWIRQHLPPDAAVPPPMVARLALASLALMASTYSMVFLEPKDPVRLRWLGEQLRAGRIYKTVLSLDAWMLSYAATLAMGTALAAAWAVSGGPVLGVIAMLGFLTRDVAIFVLMTRLGGNGKSDFVALAILAALYLVLPMILHGLGLDALDFALLPGLKTSSGLGAVMAWAQGLGLAGWAARSIRAGFTSR